MNISDRCCLNFKERPLDQWGKDNNKPFTILGLMRDEGGRRESTECLAFRKGKLRSFHPLAKVTKEWEEWFIQKYNIRLCDLYYEPYNFARTGCKGCPFNPNLQKELTTMALLMPEERKQCETIWKPVYEEYRRIGNRLTTEEQTKLL